MGEGIGAVRAALKRAGFVYIEASEWRQSVVLSGSVSSWQDYVTAGYAASGKGYKGVVNEITVPGIVDEMAGPCSSSR